MEPLESFVTPTTNSVSRERYDPGSQATSAPKHASYSAGAQIVPDGAAKGSITIGSMALCSINC